MPKANVFLSSFNSGELSRRLDARVDVAKYFSGCRILENFILRVEGGATKRPGTYYVNAAKHDDKTTILRRFVFSSDQAYILEFGDYYIRFYINSGRIEVTGTPVEVTTPYKYSEVRSCRFVQSADILHITHNNHAPRKLERTSHVDWTLSKIAFTSSEQETAQSFISITGTANSGGLIRITCGSPHGFIDGDKVTLASVGGTVEANGTWVISYVNTTTFDLVGSAYANGWTSGGTAVKEIGYYVTGCLSSAGLVKVEVPNHNFETGDMVTVADVTGTTEANGTWIITKVDDNNFTLQGSVFAGAYVSGGTAIGAGPFVEHDITNCADNGVGLIRVTTLSNHGFTTGNRVAIEDVEGCTEANGAWLVTVINATTFDLQASVFASAWTAGGHASNNWPAACSFFEQRMAFGGTFAKPLTPYLSKAGDYYNLTVSDEDDSGLEYSLLSDTVGKIKWMVPEDYLMIGCTDSEWRVGGNSKTDPITPSSINAKRQASNGSADIQGLLVGDAVLFVQKGGRRVRELAFSFEKDKYTTPDMTRLAYHISESGIVDMAPQVLPDPLVWCVRNDGQMPTLTYNRLEEVVAWARQVTGRNSAGRFESVAVIPTETDEDQIWVSTVRVINGVTKRYIEFFMPQDFGNDARDGFFVDCGLTFDGGAKTAITAATVANPPVLTVASASDLADGVFVRVVGCFGMTELNDNIYKVAGLGGTSFHLHDEDGNNIDGSAFTAFAANKTISRCYEGDHDTRLIRVECTAHGLATDNEINIFGVLGCTEANGIWTITKIDDNNFDLIDSKYENAYLSGGAVGGCLEVVAKYFTDLGHLEGLEVAACGDGKSEDNGLISGGTITLSEYYNKVHLGIPYRARLMIMKPDIGGRAGMSQGIIKRIENVIGRFEKSLDAKVGMDDENLDYFNLDEDGSGKLFTGDKELPFDGDYDTDGLVLIESEKPLPLTVTGLMIFAAGYESG